MAARKNILVSKGATKIITLKFTNPDTGVVIDMTAPGISVAASIKTKAGDSGVLIANFTPDYTDGVNGNVALVLGATDLNSFTLDGPSHNDMYEAYWDAKVTMAGITDRICEGSAYLRPGVT